MCRKSTCPTCRKWSWVGCGLHIQSAMQGIALEDRCAGWETGVCPGRTDAASDIGSPAAEEVKDEAVKLPVTCAHIENKIRVALPDVSYLSVSDLSDGCGSKFEVIVVSSAFEGVKLLQRHRMINGSGGALAVEMQHIHAMNIKAWTPKQYEKKMSKRNL